MEIRYEPKAFKFLTKLLKSDRKVAETIKNKIEQFATSPDVLKNNVKSLKGNTKSKMRLRIGFYRVGFTIKDSTLIIEKIGHRSDVYKGEI